MGPGCSKTSRLEVPYRPLVYLKKKLDELKAARAARPRK